MRKINFLILLVFIGLGVNAQITVSNAGAANGSYTSLTQAGGAFAAINAVNESSNNVVITITGNSLTEDGTNSLTGAGGMWTTLTIYPTSTGFIISGSVAGPLINLSGVTNIKIDGSLNGTTETLIASDLTISNTNASASAATITFSNNASNNTIQYCNVLGSSINPSGGVIFFSGAAATNSNNTINSCNLTLAGANRPYNMIYAVDASTGNIVENSNIYNFFPAGVAGTTSYYGIFIGNSATGWSITGNSFYDTSPVAPGGAYTYYNIYITNSSGNNFTVSNNYIGGTASALVNGITGTWGLTAAQAFAFCPIYLNVSTSGTASNIQNNTISGLSLNSSCGATGAPGIFTGIDIAGGSANVGTMGGNYIGSSPLGSGTITALSSSTNTGLYMAGISVTSTGSVNIQNNYMANIKNTGTAVATSYTFYGIKTAGTGGVFTITGNNIGNATTLDIVIGLSSSTVVENFYGINNAATGTTNITYNTIQNCESFGSSSASNFTGIYNSGATAAGAILNMNYNALLTNTLSGGTGIWTGIENNGACTGTININNNIINTGVASSSTNDYVLYNAAAGSGSSLSISSNILWGSLSNAGTFNGIYNSASPLNSTISSNNFKNLINGGPGPLYLIYNSYTAPANGTKTVQNNYITTSCTVASITNPFYCYYDAGGSPSSVSHIISGNNFSNISGNSQGSFNGIYSTDFSGSNPSLSVYNNTISNVSLTQTGAACSTNPTYGIYLNGFSGTSGTPNTVYNNIVSNINVSNTFATNTTSPSMIEGIYIGAQAQYINVNNNNINTLTAAITGATVNTPIYGLYLAGGTSNTNNIYNNFISNITTTPTLSAVNAVSGIYLNTGTATTTNNLYYNTIYLNATSTGTTFGSSGIYSSTTPTLTLYNNIIINISTPGSTSGNTVALSFNNNTFSHYTGNNNNFYAGSPGVHNLIYYDGTNSTQCLSGFQSLVGSNDNSSISENTSFVNTSTAPYNLNISTSIPTFCESHGTPITTPIAITTDYYGNPRWGTTGYTGTGTAPDMGANEGNFTGINVTASSASLCLSSGTTTLTLPNIPTGYSGTYQWQQSSTGTSGWTNVTGATSVSYTTSATLPYTPTTYYRAQLQILGCPTSYNYSNSGSVSLHPGSSPALTSTNATSPCLGLPSTVTVSFSSLTDGIYQVTYNLTGNNTATGSIATMTVSSNVGTFSTSALTNSGSTTVTIKDICSYTISSNNTATFTVSSPAAAVGSSQTISVCSGSVTIGAAQVGTDTYNWTSNPAGFISTIANPTVSPIVTTTYTLTETTPSGCQNTNSVTVTVNQPQSTFTVGYTGANYSTLGAAFSDINNGVICGNIILQINNNTTETGTCTLNANGTYGGSGTSNYSSVKIYPTGAGGWTINSNISGPLVFLNGATNVTIDGRISGNGSFGSPQLTILNTNTSPGASTIKFQNNASNNTIQNCIVKGSSTSVSGGVIFFYDLLTANSNNTINYCNLTNAGGNRPYNMIYAYDASLGNTVSNNNIYDFINPVVTSCGINIGGYSTAWTITGNSFYDDQVSTPISPTGAWSYYSIYISNITTTILTGSSYSTQITGNYIGGSAPNCGSSPWTINSTGNFAYKYNGIYVSSSTLTTLSITINGNYIENTLLSGTGASTFTGIENAGAAGYLYMNNNTLANNNLAGTGAYTGIWNAGSVSYNININNNAINSATLSASTPSNAVTLIYVSKAGGNQLIGTTQYPFVSIGWNTISGINFTNTGTGTFTGIGNNSAAYVNHTYNNNFNNLSLNTTGIIYLINFTDLSSLATGITQNVENNYITGSCKVTAAGGSNIFYCMYNTSGNYGWVQTGSIPYIGGDTISGNNFTNISIPTSNTGGFYALNSWNYFFISPTPPCPNQYIYNNTISNVTCGSGSIYGIYATGFYGSLAQPNTVNNNIISHISCSSAGTIYGIYVGNFQEFVNVYNNTISNISSSAAASLYGIYVTPFATATFAAGNSVYNNNINTLSTTGTPVYGAYLSGIAYSTDAFYNNTINNITSGGILYGAYISLGNLNASGSQTVMYGNQIYNLTGTTSVYGADFTGAAPTAAAGSQESFYQNNIYNITSTGASGTVYGFYMTLGKYNYCYNNFISQLNAPASTNVNGVVGIYANTTNVNTLAEDIFYNTIYLNATSTGTGFGSSGIYYNNTSTSVTPTITLIDNIDINLSTPTGAGYTSALTFANNTISRYSTTSNNNNFYAGTPGAKNVIFYNLATTTGYQCLSSFQTLVSPGDNASITENTSFNNPPTNFNITTSPTFCESHGTPITTALSYPVNITTDANGNPRWGAGGYAGNGSAPDIGAVEGNYTGITATGPSGINTTYCSGNSTTITLTYAGGYSGTIQWQQSSTGTSGWGTVSGGSGGTTTIYTTPALSSNTYYRAQLQEFSGSCTNTVYSTVASITIIPAATAYSGTNSSTTICSSGTYAVTGATVSNDASFNWGTSGNGTFTPNNTTLNPTYTPGSADVGSVTLTLTAIGNSPCANATSTIILTVNQAPTTPITGSNTPVCTGNTLNLTASSTGGASYNWTGPNGFTSPSQNPSIAGVTTLATGTYYVTVTLNGCTSTATTGVTVNSGPSPTISIYGTEGNPVCAGAVRIRYYTESGETGYTWKVSGGNITSGSGTSQIQVTWNASGIDTVSVNYTSGTCSASTKYLVTAYANANVSLQPSPVTIATGKNTSFSIASDPSNNLGLSYQWQVSTNSGSSYSNVTNTGIYTGATTTTLNLTNVTAGYSGNLYKCLVFSTSPCSSALYSNAVLLTITTPTSGLWDGGTSTDWSDGTNWDDGNVPLSTTNVVIPSSAPNQPLLSGSGTCNNITINPKASLSVTGTLACEGNLLIKSDGTGTGAFTQNDAAIVGITGTVTVQRYLSNLGYHYLASPLQSVTCDALIGFGSMTYTGGGTWYDPNHPAAISPYPNMWRIDEAHTHLLCPSDYNSWYAPAKTETMSTGLGYAINIATGAKTVSVSNPGSDLNAGTYTASVSKEALSTNTIYNNDNLDQYGIINGSGAQNVGTGPTNGWHLIGNPYPSPVDWNALVNGGGVGTNIGYGISFFKPTTQWTGVYGSYYYNTAHITSSSGAFNPGRYIPSMQSFFIQNNVVSTPVLTFQNAYRNVTSAALNANFYRSDEIGVESSETIPNISLYGYQTEGHSLQTSASSELLKDKAVIMFGAQNTDFGTGKLMNTDENVPNIYSFSEERTANSEEGLSIQGISEFKSDMIIPLGFDVNTSGNYIINAGEILNFPAGTHIYLEDMKNNAAQDLTINPNYSFAISKGDADNRFYLKFGHSLQTSASSAEMFDAYSNENVLVVNYNNPTNAEGTLSILNLLGQNVQELRIENGELRINPKVAPGVYMVRLVTNDKVYIKKVYIQ